MSFIYVLIQTSSAIPPRKVWRDFAGDRVPEISPNSAALPPLLLLLTENSVGAGIRVVL